MSARLWPGAVVVVVAFALGCGEDVAPASYVDKLRVLSVVASPPELAPGEQTVLSALVVDPSRPDEGTTLVWLACDPDPQDLSRSSCSDVGTLSDPGAFTPPQGSEGAQLPPGVRAIGLGPVARYKAPVDAFAALDASDPRRTQGAVAQVLLIAIAKEIPPGASQDELNALFEKVKSREIPSLLTIFRLRVTEDPARNHNPALSGITENGQPLPEGARLRFFPDQPTPLGFSAPDDAFEAYDQLVADTVEQRKERLIAALYSTTGRFTLERLEVGSPTEDAFIPPDGGTTNPVPEDRRGTLWVVLRDTRGGQSFQSVPFVLCDRSLPEPVMTLLSPGGAPPNTPQKVTLGGRNLSSVLDVGIGGKALTGLSYDADAGVLRGTVPALGSGEYPLVVRGEHCADVQTSFTYRVP